MRKDNRNIKRSCTADIRKARFNVFYEGRSLKEGVCKASDPLEPVIIDNRPMEVVKEYKILGPTISDDLKWNTMLTTPLRTSQVECISLLS